MFEEIAKRIHQVAEAWQYACDAGDFEQANFHRGELSQLIHEMKSAQQSVHWTGGDSVGFCELHQISFLQAECPRCHPASQ